MSHRACPWLVNGTPDRPARFFGIVEIRQHLHHFAAVQQFRINAMEPHDIAAPCKLVHLPR